jgi:glyoxylase-like metal-dependent hydrolase (beta-lactamase superfamily II)
MNGPPYLQSRYTFGMKHLLTSLLALAATVLPPSVAGALELLPVAKDTFALVGDLGQRSPANLGSNSTHGFIVTQAGVIIIDPGATKKGAQEIERHIRTVTNAPIVAVINTGGQDHRWLGNSHFKGLGARLIASKAAVTDQRARFDLQWMALKMLVGDDGLQGTTPAYADETFDDRLTLRAGGTELELIASKGAHTPGDSLVWLPREGVVFAGDIVYTERLLAVLPVSNAGRWLESFAMIEALSPGILVPGHGRPTTLAVARQHTRDYLALLRDAARAAHKDGKDIETTLKTDQGAFSSLVGFDQLAKPNLQQVYIEMEFE